VYSRAFVRYTECKCVHGDYEDDCIDMNFRRGVPMLVSNFVRISMKRLMLFL